ncbi:MAG: hypothetical protein KIT73_14450, partial [Burkholderiales bacterium]|nr:hypothetical protein [Burkholderiales bacterium]
MNGLRESASGIDTDLLSSAIADGDCAQAVEAEQTRLLYRHLPATLGASLLVAVAFAAVLWQALPGQSLSMWLGALAIVCGLRFVLLLRYRHSAGDGSADVWRRRFLMGTFAAGLVWGALGWFLLPAEGYHQAFVAFLLAGVTAGSAT